MNKLFTKVAALTLGVAMAAGVGVALGSAKASEAKAADIVDSWDVSSFDNVPSSYTTDGTEYSKTVSTSGVTYYATGINSNGAIRGNKTAITGNFNLRNGTTYANYYVSKLVITTGNTGTMDPLTANRSKLIVGSTMFAKLTSATVPTGTQISAKETAAGSVLTFENSDTSVSYFMFYSLKTSGTCDSAHLEVTWSPVGDVPSTQYNVTDSVENGSVSPSKVNEGATLTATITPDTGYNVPETVSVTMGGVAATNTYQNGVVTVENVTGNIVITGTCTPKPTPTHAGTSDDPYTVADAILAIDSSITGTKYVTGVVKEIVTPYSTQFLNITFNIVDNPTDTAFIQAFRCGGTDADKVAVGDTVVVSGSIIKYQSTKYELDSGCQLVSRTAPEVDTKYTVTFNSNGGTDPEAKEVGEGLVFTFPSAGSKEGYVFKGWTNDSGVTYYQEGDTSAPVNAATTYSGEWQTKGTQNTPYSVADALAAIAANAGIRGVYTTGIVKEIVTPYDSQYSNITFNIVDSANDTDFLQVFRCKGDDASKVAVGDIALVSGNLKLHNSTPEYDANCKLESLVTPKTDWSDAEKTNFAAALDGLVPLFVKTTADPSINTETGFVDYYGEGDVKATYVSYFTQNDWHDDLGGYYSKESPNAHGVITGYVGDATATGTYIMFQYKVYVIVTVVEGEDSTEHKIGSGSDFVLPQPTESSIPAGKQFKAWEVDSVEYDPGDKLEQVTSAVTVTAVYVNAPQTAWTEEQSSAMSTALEGYVPPFYGEIYHDEFSVQGHVVRFTVFGDFSSEFAASLGEGWTLTEGKYYKDYKEGQLIASLEVVILKGDPAVSEFAFVYKEAAPTDWSDTFKTTFQSRFGTSYLPPFVNAEFANEANQNWHSTYPYCKIEVEGNYFSAAATLFNNDSNWYFLGYDEYDCPIFMSADQKAFVIIDVYLKVQGGPAYTSLTFECVGDYAVVTTDAKTEYYVGDNLDLTNVKLCAQLLDGTIVENLTIPQSYWTVSPTILTEAGDEVVITIAIAALQAEFTYNVKVTAVAMESISISGELSKTEYTEGDAWDATGLVATAHYNNGAEEDVTAQVSWTFQPEETVAGTDSVSVVATLGEISSQAANFDVVVNEPAPAYDADAFAKELLEKVAPICANYDGKKNNKTALKAVWTEMALKYETLSDEEKAEVVKAAAKTDGTDLEKAMAFYNYACKKYGLTKFIAGRQVKAIVNEQVSTGNSILPIIVIVAASVTAVTAIGVVIALKRRKNFLTK